MHSEIRSSNELAQAVRIIRDNLDDGMLEQAPLDRAFASRTPFSAINENGPWDDYVFYAFSCRSCGGRFTLAVETYHGRGGSWRPEERR